MNANQSQVDIADMIEDGRLNGFIESSVLPNIVKPDCYWEDESDGTWDLAALTPGDLMVVIAGIAGQDPSALEDEMEESFPGESAGDTGAPDR